MKFLGKFILVFFLAIASLLAEPAGGWFIDLGLGGETRKSSQYELSYFIEDLAISPEARRPIYFPVKSDHYPTTSEFELRLGYPVYKYNHIIAGYRNYDFFGTNLTNMYSPSLYGGRETGLASLYTYALYRMEYASFLDYRFRALPSPFYITVGYENGQNVTAMQSRIVGVGGTSDDSSGSESSFWEFSPMMDYLSDVRTHRLKLMMEYDVSNETTLFVKGSHMVSQGGFVEMASLRYLEINTQERFERNYDLLYDSVRAEPEMKESKVVLGANFLGVDGWGFRMAVFGSKYEMGLKNVEGINISSYYRLTRDIWGGTAENTSEIRYLSPDLSEEIFDSINYSKKRTSYDAGVYFAIIYRFSKAQPYRLYRSNNGDSHIWETMTYSGEDGFSYQGEFKNGLRHGGGIEKGTYGSRYEGEWMYGYKHGHGVMKYSDGSVYEGEFRFGHPDGSGKLTLSDGRIIEGEWENGRKK